MRFAQVEGDAASKNRPGRSGLGRKLLAISALVHQLIEQKC